MAEKNIEFYFDFSSPNAYFSSVQIQELADRHGATVTWKPMFLGGLLQELDTTAPAMQNELKARYLERDLERWAEKYGIPFSMPDNFPIVSVRPMRGVLVLKEQRPEQLLDYIEAVFEAYWVENLDISSRDGLGTVLDRLAIDRDWFFQEIESPDVKEQLKQDTDAARDRGVFGTPTFFVNGEMFWGKDRIDFVEDALAAFTD